MTIFATIVAFVTVFLTLYYLLKPKKILMLYAISRPIMQPFIFLQYKLSILPYSIIWALILPVVYVINILRGRWNFVCHKNGALLLIIFLAILSIPYTIDINASIEGLFKLFVAFSAFGIAYNTVKINTDIDYIASSIILASVVPIIFGFYQMATGNYDQIYDSVTKRVNSVFGVGNAYGIFLTITMCSALMLLLKKSLTKNKKILLVIILTLMSVSQIAALNRGTWIALSVAVIVAIFSYNRKVNYKWFVFGAVIIALVFSGVIYKRFTDEGVRYTGEKRDTFKQRIEFWTYMIPIILDRPLIGYGVGTTGETKDKNGLPPPHNDYVLLAADIGIPGSIVYLYYLTSLALFYLNKRNKRNKSLITYNFSMAILSCYMIIISLTQNIIYNQINFVLFMFLNGAVIKLNIITKKNRHTERSMAHEVPSNNQ